MVKSKTLNRNKSPFYFSLFVKTELIYDEYGNESTKIIYTDPKPYKANISAAMGESATRQFGDLELYDKVIVFDDVNTPIDESAILWIDRMPKLDGAGSLVLDENGNAVTPHDYIVKKKAVSINVVSLAVKKVNVT